MSDEKSLNFLEEIIEKDLADGKYTSIVTRFPPEPNGYLHMGHATSICLNFGLSKKYPGYTNLRFDDTNPVTEDTEYVESIKEDIKWLGFEWKHERYASDYFEELYQYAITLIKKGLAYVDDISSEEMATLKGSPTEPGKDSPFRNRTVEENLELFAQMRNGDFPDGARTLRAKINMSHPNMLMRDPILYRIKHAHHHRTGDKWCIYPMYDFAHGQSDSIENITHSICTLEFVPHRELYDWFIEKLEIYPSHQYEFARRNLSYTVMSKRKLLQLVNDKHVNGWDDPRMPTIRGMRRRGFTPASIRKFCETVGIAKRENVVDFSLLEFCLREDLNNTAKPIEDARMHAMLCYRTTESFKAKFDRTVNEELAIFNIESWLNHHGEKLQKRFQLSAYKLMNQLLKTIDISRNRESFLAVASKIEADIHIIGINSDLFFTVNENKETYETLKKYKENVTFQEIDSIHGHDAFLIEYKQLDNLLKGIFKLEKNISK